MSILILTEQELRRCVGLDLEALAAVAEGFSKFAAGKATVPPILRLDVPDFQGEVDVKTAYIQGLDSFAVKVASGFFNNQAVGLPSGSGLMLLLSAQTGFPLAVLLDNGYLTDVRTGLAGALAAQYLAKPEIHTVGVIGSGMQSRYQVRALRLVRDFERVLVHGTNPASVEAYAQEMNQSLGVRVDICESYEAVVCQSDVVVTTTPSRQPFLQSEWLFPGQHITCMGSDAEHKQELDVQAFTRANRIVCDSKAQCFRLGELHHALEAGLLSESAEITELGELTSGRKPGRQSPEEITICDLTGVGVQDTAIARFAYERARKMGMGVEVG